MMLLVSEHGAETWDAASPDHSLPAARPFSRRVVVLFLAVLFALAAAHSLVAAPSSGGGSCTDGTAHAGRQAAVASCHRDNTDVVGRR
jgi:hypothetical protein